VTKDLGKSKTHYSSFSATIFGSETCFRQTSLRRMSTILDSIAAVREAISNKKPFCTGTYPLSENAGLLFFRGEKDDVAGSAFFLFFPTFISLILGDALRWIDLSNPTTPKLQALLEACDPVLKDNDAHPKAWKLDNPNFSTRFDMLDAGIVDHVRSKLAKGGFVPLERVRAELRELNVHGE
jgi:hypothetical protein